MHISIGFIIIVILAGFIGRIFFIEKAFDKGAVFACTDVSTYIINDVKLISKKKGAHLIGNTSAIQKNKTYNLFFCDVVKDDNFEEIKKEIRKEMTE